MEYRSPPITLDPFVTSESAGDGTNADGLDINKLCTPTHACSICISSHKQMLVGHDLAARICPDSFPVSVCSLLEALYFTLINDTPIRQRTWNYGQMNCRY